jgi:predicted phosphodiesterase
MRLAVLSDIHGNLEALTAVLRDLDAQGIDETVSLGDNIGYGADSEAVVELVRGRGIKSVMGNHENGLIEPAVLRWFNPGAREVLLKTRDMLSDDSIRWLGGLPASMSLHGCRLVHGFPPSSITTYLFEASDAQIQRTMQELPEELSFCGHTHELLYYRLNSEGLKRFGIGRLSVELAPGERMLVNAGSVGQPRDGDPHAKYLIWDSRERVLTPRFVAYNIPGAQEKIRALKFPDYYADRLGEPSWELSSLDPEK